MDTSSDSWSAQVLGRLGDGHGRRLLLVLPLGAEGALALANELARRAWAVSVRSPDEDLVLRGRRDEADTGLVVDWQTGRPGVLGVPADRFSVALCAGDPGLADAAVRVEVRRALKADGLLLVLLSGASPAPALPEFGAVRLVRCDGLLLLTARC